MSSIQRRDLLITVGAPLIWGTTYYTSTNLLPSDYPLFLAAMRALPIGLILLLIVRNLPQGQWWWRSFVLGFFNIGLFFALLFVGAVRLPGGVAATVGAIQPLLVVFLVWLVFGERPRLRTVGLALMGLVGVAALVLSAQARLDPLGIAAAVGAAASMALGTVLGKRWGRPVPLLSFTAWQLVAGGIVLLPLALLVEGVPQNLQPIHYFGFTYMGIVNTGIAYMLWFHGVDRLPTTLLPMLGLLTPVVAMTVGFLLLGQSLTGLQLLGAVVVLSSVLLSQRQSQAATKATPPTLATPAKVPTP